MDREEIIRLIEDYMAALRSGDYSSVRFSQSVNFLGPLMDSPIEGKSKVVEFLIGVSEGVKDVRVQKHIVDGSTACVLIKYETTNGDVLPILDYFQFDEEGISHIQPFFDPRPLIE
jgi:hypothetical protein